MGEGWGFEPGRLPDYWVSERPIVALRLPRARRSCRRTSIRPSDDAYLEWAGGSFNPARFDVTAVNLLLDKIKS
jgi:hypothetical protein